jgi:FAD synthase
MQHHRNLNEISLEGSILSIGSFDGVHLGHQQIIRSLVKSARQANLPAVIVTFHPHPQLIINAETRPYYLTLPEKRAELLGELGVDHVLTYPFSPQISQKSPEDFINDLVEKIQFKELWVGYLREG